MDQSKTTSVSPVGTRLISGAGVGLDTMVAMGVGGIWVEGDGKVGDKVDAGEALQAPAIKMMNKKMEPDFMLFALLNEASLCE